MDVHFEPSALNGRIRDTDLTGFFLEQNRRVVSLDVGVFSMFHGLDTDETSGEPPAASHCSFRFDPRELARESLIILGLVERPIEARGAHFERVGRLNRIFHVEQERQALADALAVFEADAAANVSNVPSVPSVLDALDEDPEDPASPLRLELNPGDFHTLGLRRAASDRLELKQQIIREHHLLGPFYVHRRRGFRQTLGR
jgi:hypothetical protein